MQTENNSQRRHITILDTTLRDGQLTPGVSFTLEQKVEVAHALARLGVDVIEAGYAIDDQSDLAALERIAFEVKNVVIAGLAGANQRDIDRVWAVVKAAERPRLHLYLSASDILLKHLSKISRETALAETQRLVSYARSLGAEVEFSAYDATRADLDFLCQIVEVAIAAGATIINLPDTVGCSTPADFAQMVAAVKERVNGSNSLTLSVHCHNDMNLAVANSLAGLQAGATQIECTVNGLGDRAGNAALQEFVSTLSDQKEYAGFSTSLDTDQLAYLSQLVSDYSQVKTLSH